MVLRLKETTRVERQSCLNDLTLPVVADTSVIINLNASGCAEAILDALPNRFLVVSEVRLELEEDRHTGRNDAAALTDLVASGRVEIAQLGDSGIQHFSDLGTGSASQTLDDGEAATIAYALEHGAVALIDERKANRICTERFPALVTGSTVDLLAQGNVQAALGHDRLAEAVFHALRHGRMRVLPHHVPWVVDLIGQTRAARCPSLPRSVRSA